MNNAEVQKKHDVEPASVARGLWDPFWFIHEMFGWAPPGHAPSFDVKETNDSYVYNVKVKLTLPDQADVAHVKAELDNGELRLVVPKAAAATPEPVSPPPRTRRKKETGRGSAARKRRRGARSRSRRG